MRPRASEVGPDRHPLLGHQGSSVFATWGAGVLRTGMILIIKQESEGQQCDLQQVLVLSRLQEKSRMTLSCHI